MRSLTRMALAATGEAPAVPELKRPARMGAGAEDNCDRDRERKKKKEEIRGDLILNFKYKHCSGITVTLHENE